MKVDLGKQYRDNPLKCPCCGRTMFEVKDKMQNKFTGFNWRCKCMSKGQVLVYA
jgi:hypothetical protein